MDYKKELLNRNHRPFTKGELVVLAKLLSDKIRLVELPEFDVKQYILLYKSSIVNFVYALNNYTYVTPEQVTKLLSLIENFVNWRYNIAFKPSNPLWNRGPNYTIDETSLLPKYVDINDICEIGDTPAAGYLYAIFSDMVKDNPITKMGE